MEEISLDGFQNRKRRIVLGVTGSVATIKLEPLLDLLLDLAEARPLSSNLLCPLLCFA